MTDQPQYVEHKLIKAIAQHPGLGELEVEVAVEGGVIRLSGRVASARHRQELIELVQTDFPDYEVADQTEPVEVPPAPTEQEEIS